jgi:hypothetical protein
MKKIKEYLEDVGTGQAIMFSSLEYKSFILGVCIVNFINIFTNQQETVFIITLFFTVIGYLTISLKFLLHKIFRNSEVDSVMKSLMFIMLITFFAYIIITYIRFFMKS